MLRDGSGKIISPERLRNALERAVRRGIRGGFCRGPLKHTKLPSKFCCARCRTAAWKKKNGK